MRAREPSYNDQKMRALCESGRFRRHLRGLLGVLAEKRGGAHRWSGDRSSVKQQRAIKAAGDDSVPEPIGRTRPAVTSTKPARPLCPAVCPGTAETCHKETAASSILLSIKAYR